MNNHYDIVIAGGGIIGSAVAFYLSKNTTYSIALVDIKKPGNSTRASAGGLWPIGESVGLGCGVIFFKTLSKRMAEASGRALPPLRPHVLPKFFFDFCLRSNSMFPGLADEMKNNYGLDFKLEKTGLKFIMYNDSDITYANQIAASIPELEHHLQWLSADELKKDEPNVNQDSVGALQFMFDDQLNPFLLLKCYREASRQNGVDLYLENEIQSVVHTGGKISGVKIKDKEIGCDLLINAAGAWASDISKMAYGEELPIRPVKGQIVLSETMPKILNSCLSSSDCYMAQKDNGEILIGSTTEEKGFDATVTVKKLALLSEGAVKCVPMLKHANIKRTWAGLRPGTPDEIPILGAVDGVDGYLNACGHFRTGILTSAVTGEILVSLVEGKEPPINLKPFLLSRFSEKANVTNLIMPS